MATITSSASVLSCTVRIFFIKLIIPFVFILDVLFTIPGIIFAQLYRFKIPAGALGIIGSFLYVVKRIGGKSASLSFSLDALKSLGAPKLIFTFGSVAVAVIFVIFIFYFISHKILSAVCGCYYALCLKIEELKKERQDSFNRLSFKSREDKEKVLREDFRKQYNTKLI